MHNTRLTGPDAWNIAKRKNKYGDKTWIGWTDRNGIKQADIYNSATVREAMLATGTQGVFYHFDYGVYWVLTWPMAVIWLRNAKGAERRAGNLHRGGSTYVLECDACHQPITGDTYIIPNQDCDYLIHPECTSLSF